MAHAAKPVPMGPHPFGTLLRSSDRERLIVQLIAAVWDSMLGLPILPRAEPQDPVPDPGQPLLSATVRISGEWAGSVVMCVPFTLARDCAALMYGSASRGLQASEVADAWGELANMVGGNLKSLLPPPAQLSLPLVGATSTWLVAEEGAESVNEVTFACLGKRMRVTILRRTA